MKTVLLLIALAAALSGCQFRSITSPGGAKYTSVSLGTGQTIGPISITTKDGTTVKVEGYTSEQAQVAAASVEAAVRAALK